MKILLIPTLVSIFLSPALTGQVGSFGSIDFDNTLVEVNLNNVTLPIQVLEYSDGLSSWTPISRNYGNGWESVFPNAHSINTNAQGDSQISLSKNIQGFFRYRYETSHHTYTELELVSLFLMQATFGPNLSSITSFPGVFDPILIIIKILILRLGLTIKYQNRLFYIGHTTAKEVTQLLLIIPLNLII